MNDLWASFPIDPRDKANAGLRASDEDRERITAELASAFAAGRLDADELDQRTTAATAARTLGELPPIVADLVPLQASVRSSKSLVGRPHAELRQRAEDHWRDQRRSAILAFVVSSLFFWAIWGITALRADSMPWPWPAFITVFVGLPVLRVIGGHDQIVRDELGRLESKQARQQRWPRGLP